MKKEYDFSAAEQGKFYCKSERMKIPVYIDSSLESFYAERARVRKIDMSSLINMVLRKEMDLVKEFGL
jgi:post-segregation antitoxin (ccd killing protein)